MPLPCPPSHSYLPHSIFSTPIPPHHLPQLPLPSTSPTILISSTPYPPPQCTSLTSQLTLLGSPPATVARLLGEKGCAVPTSWDPQGQSSSCSEMGTVESSGPVWPLQSTAPVRGPPHLCGYPRKSGLELALPTVCSSIPHTPSQAASPSMASSCLAPGCLPGARSHPRRTLLP